MNKDETLKIRITADELKEYERVSRELNLSLSAWCRMVLAKAAKIKAPSK